MANKARHAYGKSTGISDALQAKVIDAFDVLFLDGDTEPKMGWIDKNGNSCIVDTEKVITITDDSLPLSGELNKIYLFKEEAYFWNGTEFKPLAKEADLVELEAQLSTKVDATKVQEMIDASKESFVEIIEF